jgi:hypothetical protein
MGRSPRQRALRLHVILGLKAQKVLLKMI